MDIYKSEINRILNELKELLKKYKFEYDEMPEGHLICCKNGSRHQFMQVDTANGGYVRKCINRQPNLIRKYARKEYLKRTLDSLRGNIDLLSKVGSKMRSIHPDDILSSMRKAYRRLPESAFFDPLFLPVSMCDDDLLRKRMEGHAIWANSDYHMSTYMPEYRRMPTSQGIHVRSKSEQLIVEMLYKHGIPFRYEEVIPIGSKEYSADFTFETADGQRIFWEHAGMMDDPTYADGHLKKLKVFQMAGIVLGDNLLVTYDRDGSVNMAMIEAIIENEIIPRL